MIYILYWYWPYDGWIIVDGKLYIYRVNIIRLAEYYSERPACGQTLLIFALFFLGLGYLSYFLTCESHYIPH